MPTRRVILEYDPQRFDPAASYVFIGRTPRDFPEVLNLELWVDRTAVDGPIIESFLYTGQSQPIVFALITERQLFFVTAPAPNTGIEYRFDGQFLRGGFMSEVDEGKVVLKGTLTKSKNGRTIAESVVRFQVVQDHC